MRHRQEHQGAQTGAIGRVAVQFVVEALGDLFGCQRRCHFLCFGRCGDHDGRLMDAGLWRRLRKPVGDVGGDERKPEARRDDAEGSKNGTDLETEEGHEGEAKEQGRVVI